MSTRVAITGSGGLLGFHARALLYAQNRNAEYKNFSLPYEVILVSTEDFDNPSTLKSKLADCELILHFAGVNRASDEVISKVNPGIARSLVEAIGDNKSNAPTIVYSNTTHSYGDTEYGRSKQLASDILRGWSVRNNAAYYDCILPHLFGEFGKPNYNSVTATFSASIAKNIQPEVSKDGVVELIHARDAVLQMLSLVSEGSSNYQPNAPIRFEGREISVPDLFQRIKNYSVSYRNNVIPDLGDKFDLDLFNTYRSYEFPGMFPFIYDLKSDDRGELFETIRCSKGQTFLSWTHGGVERGNHFHLRKVERFVVLSGSATIYIRKLFDSKIYEFPVSGSKPCAVDMPTMYTHSIVNTGTEPLLTLFWSNEWFDESDSDTYFEPVTSVETPS